MSNHHILLLGGHGKIAQLLTPILLSRSWAVTSVIRNPDQKSTVQKLGEGQKGKLDVLVESLEDVKSEADAKSILEKVKPDYVVWSAGAGGKGGPERTFAIDRDAAIHFIHASASTPSISQFLLISYLGSRRQKPSWWSDSEWEASMEVNKGALKNYYKAKIEADEVLYKVSKDNKNFHGICLRPGLLTDEPAGKVRLGKLEGGRGKISRASVAEVTAKLLEKGGYRGWLDLLDGEEEVEAAVERCVKGKVDCAEGEPVY